MIADRIKAARESKSMTKAELARRVCVSRASVSMWEDGKNISIHNIHRIASVLDVAPEWLQYGVDDNTVKVDELADCLLATRRISSQFDWDLSDEQHAKVAAYLYSERSKGESVPEQEIVNLVQAEAQAPTPQAIAV